MTLFCAEITTADKHFLSYKPLGRETVLYLSLSAPDLCAWCKKKKEKKKNHKQKYCSGVTMESRFLSAFGFYELQCSIFALQPSKCFPGQKRLWQPRYAPQQYTGVCLQPRRPLYKPTACTTAASPRSTTPSYRLHASPAVISKWYFNL